MTSSLPMYAAGSAAGEALWNAIAEQLPMPGVPAKLSQPTDLLAHWLDPQLLLSQTCGYPLTHALAGQVQLVGTFIYTAPGCDGLHYRSQLVCRNANAGLPLAEFRGRTVAYNAEDSQSGYHSLRALVAPLARNGRFFGQAVVTGSHRASVDSVRSGQADLAAIDCVTWALLLRDHPEVVRGVQVCGHTASTPGLPLITSLQTSPEVLAALRRALRDAMHAPALVEARATLLIQDFVELVLSDFDAIPQMETCANSTGYRL